MCTFYPRDEHSVNNIMKEIKQFSHLVKYRYKK